MNGWRPSSRPGRMEEEEEERGVRNGWRPSNRPWRRRRREWVVNGWRPSRRPGRMEEERGGGEWVEAIQQAR